MENIFKKYTMAIAEDYEKTTVAIAAAQTKPPKKVYNTMDSLLKECFFLGATRFGTNFVC